MKAIVFYLIGRILQLEGLLLMFPLLVSFIYGEPAHLWGSFLGTALGLILLGSLISIRKPKNSRLYARDGLVVCSLSWFLLSAFGALPLVLSGEYPTFIDAFFEIASGFTTTGATVITAVESLSHSILFWRSFTHLIGGMGVLVFALAILPSSGADTIHVAKAEVPGPSFSKIVAKLSRTARILYLIYLAMTAVLVLLLVLGGMPLFDSLCHAFGAAGTGGFGIKNNSIAYYHSPYIEFVLAVAMIMFGVNFNLYYLILLKQFKKFFKSEELRWYLGFIAASTFIIFLQTYRDTTSPARGLLNAFFTVSSIITTTGYSTVDFDLWPLLSRGILLLLMFIGASAGSTGGGLKVSRVVMMMKAGFTELRQAQSPNRVLTLRFEDEAIRPKQLQSILCYLSMYAIVFTAATLLLLLDVPNFITGFSAVAATINNIGPGLDLVGPSGNFGFLSPTSKLVLTFCMIAGRLELWPVLILFSPATWKRV